MLAFTVASHICISSPNKLLCLEKRLQLLLFHDRAPLSSATHPFAGMFFHSPRPSRRNGENRLLASSFATRAFPSSQNVSDQSRLTRRGILFHLRRNEKLNISGGARGEGGRGGKTHTSHNGGDCLTSGEIINKAGVL